MKKLPCRICALLVMGCMLTALLPPAVAALPSTAKLVAGMVTLVENGQSTGKTVAGASYDAATNTLTLTNYSHIQITAQDMDVDFTIELVGDNHILPYPFSPVPEGTASIADVFVTGGDLTLTGGGIFRIHSISVNGNCTVNGPKFYFTPYLEAFSVTGTLSIVSGDINITPNSPISPDYRAIRCGALSLAPDLQVREGATEATALTVALPSLSSAMGYLRIAKPVPTLTVDGVALIENGVRTTDLIAGTSYDPATNTLTLENYAGGLIFAQDMGLDFTIALSGENTIAPIDPNTNTMDYLTGSLAAIFVKRGDLALTGTGSLTVTRERYHTLPPDEGVIVSVEGHCTVDGPTLNFNPGQYGFKVAGTLTAASGSITITAGTDVISCAQLVVAEGLSVWEGSTIDSILPVDKYTTTEYIHCVRIAPRAPKLTLSGTVILENGAPTGNTVPGASYDAGTNTLTLAGYTGGQITADELGDGFTVHVTGENSVSGADTSYKILLRSTSVLFTGDGTLNCGSLRAYLGGFALDGPSLNTTVTVSDDIDIRSGELVSTLLQAHFINVAEDLPVYVVTDAPGRFVLRLPLAYAGEGLVQTAANYIHINAPIDTSFGLYSKLTVDGVVLVEGYGKPTGLTVPGASYDAATNTLTLTNYNGGQIDIQDMSNRFTICAQGTNTIRDHDLVPGITGGGTDLVLTGDGTLLLDRPFHSSILLSSGSLIVDGPTVYTDLNDEGSPRIQLMDGDFWLRSGHVSAQSNKSRQAIRVEGDLVVSGGTLVASGAPAVSAKRVYTNPMRLFAGDTAPGVLAESFTGSPKYIRIAPFCPDTLAGAQIRTRGKPGLRFLAEFEKPLTRVAEYGTLLVPTTANTDKNTLVIDGDSVVKVPAARLYDETDTKVQFTAVLTDIAPEHYSRSISARAYAILEDGTTVYSDTITTRSLFGVAQAALQDTSVTWSESERAYLQEIVNP